MRQKAGNRRLPKPLAAPGARRGAGCDSDDTRPPPPEGADVRAFEVDFDLDGATREGGFATAPYDASEPARAAVAVAEEGLVIAYVREAGTWTALSYTCGVEAPEQPVVDYTVSLGYGFETGFVELFYEPSRPMAKRCGSRCPKKTASAWSPSPKEPRNAVGRLTVRATRPSPSALS
ncbi:MAG: hypothetical protein BRD48_02990 [Bacteroidetes bacterium QS_9_68_14]|nr:MAG: hypothetical protein BRD48_02990 [Bacteroidetes bacterium QS_9_68_14]